MDIVTALLILGVQGILESDVKLRSELIKQKQRRAPFFDMLLQSVGRRKVVEEKRKRKTRGMLYKGWRTCRRFVKQPSQQILPALSTATWCHQAGCLVATPAAAQVTTPTSVATPRESGPMWTWLGTRMKFPCLKLNTQGNNR